MNDIPFDDLFQSLIDGVGLLKSVRNGVVQRHADDLEKRLFESADDVLLDLAAARSQGLPLAEGIIESDSLVNFIAVRDDVIKLMRLVVGQS